MWHKNRSFSVADVVTAEELAKKLTQYTWSLCNGFRLGELLFLNDSTSPDGLQEYAVVHEPTSIQVESITFGWCNCEQALELIREVQRDVAKGTNLDLDRITNKIQTPQEHGRCGHCA